MNNVRLAKGDGDVAVGVRRRVMLERDGGAVELQAALGRKHLAGKPPGGGGRKL